MNALQHIVNSFAAAFATDKIAIYYKHSGLGFVLAVSSGLTAFMLMPIAELAEEVKETSGLIFIDGQLITHNDSGNEPVLYQIDTTSGEVIRSVFISGAAAGDWEDVCRDSTSIYIANIGNNLGSRRDLVIYKVSIDSFLRKDTVQVEDEINFRYGDQTDFSPSQFSTNYDAEALACFGDSLMILTKRWGDYTSTVYVLPKQAEDTLELEPRISLPLDALVTGAVFQEETSTMYMSGYKGFEPLLMRWKLSIGEPLSTRDVIRTSLPINTAEASSQIEGITHLGSRLYISAEENILGRPASLFSLKDQISSAFTPPVQVESFLYPNPAKAVVTVSLPKAETLKVLDVSGKIIAEIKASSFTVEGLPPGLYSVLAYDRLSQVIARQQLLVQ